MNKIQSKQREIKFRVPKTSLYEVTFGCGWSKPKGLRSWAREGKKLLIRLPTEKH